MSFEAVPCMFRSSQGPNGETEYLGLLIRPSATTPTNPPTSSPSQSSSSRPPAPLKVQGVFRSGAPITVSGEHAPKLLVPANVQVRLAAGTGDAITSSAPMSIASSTSWQSPAAIRMSTTFTSPVVSSPSMSQNRSVSVCSSSPFADSCPMSPAMTMSQPHQGHRQAQVDVRGLRPSSSAQQWQLSGDSSTTPDSGIQSIPGSPPSNHTMTPPTIEACSSVCEDRPDEEDYADMPCLMPAGHDEPDTCQPGTSGVRGDECASLHGSECETAATPSISITPGMDSRDIVEQLLQLDPDKASEISKLIRRKTLEKRKGDSRQDLLAAKKCRPGSAASDELRKSEEELKRDSPPVLSDMTEPEPSGSCDVTPFNNDVIEHAMNDMNSGAGTSIVPAALNNLTSAKMLYRQAVKRMLQQKLCFLVEKTVIGMCDLHIGERERHERRGGHREAKNTFHIDWEAVRRRARKEEERKKREERKRRSDSFSGRAEKREKDVKSSTATPSTSVRRRKRREVEVPESTDDVTAVESKERRNSRSSQRAPSKRRASESIADDVIIEMDKRKEIDYDQIRKSFCVLPPAVWSSPSPHCGCTRGACTSDAECINRALLVQCPINCQATLCVNKKFWKEDVVRNLIASGPRSKRVLKTKTTRRAGEFLGEFAGEIITYPEAVARHQKYEEKQLAPRILCASASLFVDATERGNLARYVRHSCTPNSRLEVWSIGGRRRAGIFSLFDIASGSEITIDMDRLLARERACTCGTAACRRTVRRARNAILCSAEDDVSIADEQLIRDSRVLLMRNRQRTVRMAARNFSPSCSAVPSSLVECMRRVLDGLQLRVRRIDGSLPYSCVAGYSSVRRLLRSPDCTLEAFQAEVERWLDVVDDDDVDRVYSALSAHYLSNGSATADSSSKQSEKKREGRTLKREMDLSYLEAGCKVGSYNPDEVWPTGKAKEGDDAVRCECGSLEEDGEMLQCDVCHFWLHTDCVGGDIGQADDAEYACKFCAGDIKQGVPSTDVVLAKQPDIRLEGCKYYKALNNRRSIQVRLNETVYVEKTNSDEHKKILKRLMENNEKSPSKSRKKEGEEPKKVAPIAPPLPFKKPARQYERKELRLFRVERLFAAPSGHHFVFGFYYARPHETICDSQRIFHRNEVFSTPFYDTLPLDAVVGRCTVLDPDVWCKGRPLVPLFKEDDVFVCEYQIDKHQRSFEKIPARHRFPINTQPYVFGCFEAKRQLVRDFTPFMVGDQRNGGSRCGSRSTKPEKSTRQDGLARQMASRRLSAVVDQLCAPPGKVCSSNSTIATATSEYVC